MANYDIGGLTMDEEGIKISAYLQNTRFEGFPSWCIGAYDRSLLGIGGKPDYWIAVQKIAGYLGETDGSGNLTIAPENKVWTSDDIKFNGTLGAVDEMPGCNSESPVYLDTDIDLVPEPVTVLLLGAGFVGTVLAGRKKA
ncbi:MAG: PEP-CTERM sorting domain-containing protein [Planctomycetota bacterium]